MTHAIRNILFIAEGQIGDLLLLTPALRATKSSFTHATISVVVLTRRDSAPAGELVRGPLPSDANSVLATNPHVDRLYTIDRQRLKSTRGLRRITAEVEIVRFLRKQKYDAVVSTFPEDRFALWAFASGARIRIGDRTSPLARFYTRYAPTSKGEHGVLQYYLDEVKVLGAAASNETTEYQVPSFAQTWADETLRQHGIAEGTPFAAIHPGASGDYKIWPPENFAGLIDRLQEVPGIRAVLVYGNGDRRIAESIRGRLTSSPVCIETGEHIGNLAAILRRSSLAITNDSGPRHLAVAVGVPVLSLFRKYHDKEWKAYADTPRLVTLVPEQPCAVCNEGSCNDVMPKGEEFGAHCLRSIDQERVVLQAVHMLRDIVG